MRVALPPTAVASGTVASTSNCPARIVGGQVDQRLVVAAERNAQHDELVRGRGGGVLESVELRARHHGARARRRLAGASGLARADRHRDPRAGQAYREPEAERTRRADDRDGGVGHGGGV